MGKLTGQEIINQIDSGSIIIDPFNIKNIGPNSYDLTLGTDLLMYELPHKTSYLDVKNNNATNLIKIPQDGFILYPNTLYLGHTIEIAGSKEYIPCIEGRSSLARLGVLVHLTAGFGDIGFIGKWTLEIVVIHPIKLYTEMRICQIYFDVSVGDASIKYNGKYKNSDKVQASKSYLDRELK